MTKLSYRDVLDRIFTDKELVEYLTQFLDMHKNYGAFRLSKNLPSHVVVNLIDRVKELEESILDYYPEVGRKKEEADTFEQENPETAE
jgi:hypothetical protein